MAFGNFRRGGNSGFRGGFRGNFGGPREMHKIKCSECGKDAEVPFKPKEDRPVFCRECFMKKKSAGVSESAKKPEKEEDISEEDDFDESEEDM